MIGYCLSITRLEVGFWLIKAGRRFSHRGFAILEHEIRLMNAEAEIMSAQDEARADVAFGGEVEFERVPVENAA